MDSQLTIVIPAYNEEAALVSELSKIIPFCRENDFQIIIVNDGSTDKTKQIVAQYEKEPCMRVLHHKVNRGYGGALKTGILSVQTKYLVTMDADGQHNLEDIKTLFSLMQKYNADMVVGSRQNQLACDWYRRLGKLIIRTVARILIPNTIYDINSGMKLYRTDLGKQYVPLCPNSMAFSDVITLLFINLRHLVIEHPISVKKRLAGDSTINTRTAVTTMMEIFNLLMLFNPMRLLIPISLIFFFIGTGWSIPFLLKRRGLSIVALLLLLNGIVIFLFGLVAEQISLIRKEKISGSATQGILM